MCVLGGARGCMYMYIQIYKNAYICTHYRCGISVAYLFFCLYNSTCVTQATAEQESKAFTESNKRDLCSRIRKANFNFVLHFL